MTEGTGWARARLPLERASSLPAEAYRSPSLYQRELERVLAGGWLCAARAEQVPAVGDYLSLDLLGEKLVVVRGRDERIRVLSRVCRHRGAVLVSDAGNTRSFQCPYHSWTYGLDGGLIGAPHMDGALGFDRASCALPEIASEIWEGFVFVSFARSPEPLGPQLAPLSKLLANRRLSEAVAVETARYDSRFNWKILVDNFMEAYHHIATHRDILEPVLPAANSYTPENEGPYSVLQMPFVEAPMPSSLPPLGDPDEAESKLLTAIAVFPSHLFALTANSMAWYQLLPLEVGRFELRIYTGFAPEAIERPELAEEREATHALTRTIHEQDIGACESVWSGLASSRFRSGFESGRLSRLEKPLWQFNQWWLERMGLDS